MIPERLPRLRDDVTLVPGADDVGGWRTYVLVDPVRNRYYRIGWREFEMLARWDAVTPAAMLERLHSETTLTATEHDVEALLNYLSRHHLLAITGANGIDALVKTRKAAQRDVFSWLLHHYLFIRIPLARPDAFLTRTAGWVAWMYRPGFALAMAALAVLALVLVGRQWEGFMATFPYTFGPWGLAGWGAALGLAKIIHELGHAYTLKRFGGRVPSMGVAFLVMWPVLYTDTSAAYTLTRRRQRLAVAAGGVAAELIVAVLALLLWSFLPDGPARTALFMLSTTSWITTLAINMSPLMRFDGYYLLSDLMGVPNLQERAFALARWHLRRLLLGWREPKPEQPPLARERAMLAYALAAWVYRLVLFVGIAFMVYHLFFKLLGLVLFAVEIWWFVARPLVTELAEWWHRRADVRVNRHLLTTAAAVTLATLALVVPWNATIEAPAIAQAAPRAQIFPPFPARIAQLMVKEGDSVTEGQVLARFDAPDMAKDVAAAEADWTEINWRAQHADFHDRLRDRATVLERELATAQARRNGARQMLAQQSLVAPVAGQVRDVLQGLEPGLWVGREDRLAVIAGAGWAITAYVPEADISAIAEGASARFIPESPLLPSLTLTVKRIDRGAARTLEGFWLSSTRGGPIAAREAKSGTPPIPHEAQYRVILTPTGTADLPPQVVRGWVRIDAEHRSAAARLLRSVVAILVREAGF